MNPFRNRKPSSLVVGDRIMVGHARGMHILGRSVEWPDLREATVARAEPGLVACVDGAGEPFEFAYGTPPYESEKILDWKLDRQVHWTAPLPTGAPAAVKGYAEAMLAGRDKALILHLGNESDGFREATLVCQPGSTLGGDEWDEPWSGSVEGNAAFWARAVLVDPATLPSGFGQGDLVVAPAFSCAVREGAMVTVLEMAASLGTYDDRAAIGRFMPAPPTREPFHPDAWLDAMTGSAGHRAHLEAQEIAVARTQPNEALVLWHGGDHPGCSVLSTSGVVFHNVDDVADYLWDKDQAAGLYVFENADWWSYTSYEGEHDAGIDGEWRAATPEDAVRFGFATLADLDTDVLDSLDGAEEEDARVEGISTRMMERAQAHLDESAPVLG